MRFEILLWDDIVRMTFRLAKKIRESGFMPDIIVALLRGGLVPARILSDCLGVNRIFVVGVTFYADVGRTHDKPVITQPLNINLGGSNVLIVDDVADTGETLLLVKEHVSALGADTIKTATLHKKPWSKIKPDFFVSETDSWIVYPWEYTEVVDSLRKKLQDENLSEAERKYIYCVLKKIRGILKSYED